MRLKRAKLTPESVRRAECGVDVGKMAMQGVFDVVLHKRADAGEARVLRHVEATLTVSTLECMHTLS